VTSSRPTSPQPGNTALFSPPERVPLPVRHKAGVALSPTVTSARHAWWRQSSCRYKETEWPRLAIVTTTSHQIKTKVKVKVKMGQRVETHVLLGYRVSMIYSQLASLLLFIYLYIYLFIYSSVIFFFFTIFCFVLFLLFFK
jgi:hypothetical protein